MMTERLEGSFLPMLSPAAGLLSTLESVPASVPIQQEQDLLFIRIHTGRIPDEMTFVQFWEECWMDLGDRGKNDLYPRELGQT